MQEKIQQTAADYLVKKHRRKMWKKIVGVLAGIVVFCTTYALILPAITLENHTAYCGIEAHRHTSECYEKALVCGQRKTDGSVCHHTDECYEHVLTCGKEEHAHELSCYPIRRRMWNLRSNGRTAYPV